MVHTPFWMFESLRNMSRDIFREQCSFPSLNFPTDSPKSIIENPSWPIERPVAAAVRLQSFYQTRESMPPP